MVLNVSGPSQMLVLLGPQLSFIQTSYKVFGDKPDSRYGFCETPIMLVTPPAGLYFMSKLLAPPEIQSNCANVGFSLLTTIPVGFGHGGVSRRIKSSMAI